MEPQQPHNPTKLATGPGTLVETNDGLLGTIDQVLVNPQTGEPEYLVVTTNQDNRKLSLPANLFEPTNMRDRIRLRLTRQQILEQAASSNLEGFQTLNNGNEWRIPLVEERLKVTTRPIEAGTVRVQKRVEEVEESLTVPVVHDDVEVQRVAVNKPLNAPAQPRQEGDWLVVPVMKEVLVVEKRLMLVEEVRIRRRQVTEQQEVKDTVRRERLDIEDSSKAAYQNPSADYQAPHSR